MEFNLEIRKKQLGSLKQYIKSSEENVNTVLGSLGWASQKTSQKDEPKIVCTLNKHHLISHKSVDKHLEKCALKSSNYEDTEKFLSEPLSASEYSIKIPNAKKIDIFYAARANKSDFRSAWNGRDPDPSTSDRLTSTFSVDERLALYDYSIKHTKAPPKPEEFTLDSSNSKDKKEISEREKLLLERDAKRRRTKYKSVHTSKKSHTEIMREFIDNQMDLYIEWIKRKQEKERREKERNKRLGKEKSEKLHENEYINKTYDQTQWMYGAQKTNDGVITDWSHLYQSGTDGEYYISDQATETNNSYGEASNYSKGENNTEDYQASYKANSRLTNGSTSRK